ncbi:hypothetical protein OH807_36520 [Kitasatospora sp. NBC_01560]|uniref:hypothetical protein n=1 Tax=Kitasatospora sp. NBC_01560 TaxID=2975965 RepID=UPI0038690813
MTPELTEAGLLDTWETGQRQGARARALLLAAAGAGPVADLTLPDSTPPDLTLAGLHALLLDLRVSAFGATFPCTTDCPGCGEQLDVTVEADELRPPAHRAVPGARPATGSLSAAGHEVRYRPLTVRDLLDVDPAAPDARRALLTRCLLAVEPATETVPDAVLDAVAGQLADLDPGADTAVALTCPHCGRTWTAALDIAEHLWAEVERYARRLLHDVATLARAYGWTESEVLAVSPARRRIYLETAVR